MCGRAVAAGNDYCASSAGTRNGNLRALRNLPLCSFVALYSCACCFYWFVFVCVFHCCKALQGRLVQKVRHRAPWWDRDHTSAQPSYTARARTHTHKGHEENEAVPSTPEPPRDEQETDNLALEGLLPPAALCVRGRRGRRGPCEPRREGEARQEGRH